MRIKECLTTTIKNDEREMKYSYRLTEREFNNGQAYGIEVERQDIIDDQVVNIERDIISLISNDEGKVFKLLNMLYMNEVSPIHLVDIIGEYVDEYVWDFNQVLVGSM